MPAEENGGEAEPERFRLPFYVVFSKLYVMDVSRWWGRSPMTTI